MTPVTRQCGGVSAVAATTRAWIVRMPSPLKADRLSHAFCGTVSVTVYPASDVFAFANGCADAGPAVTQSAMSVIAYTRMNSPPS